MRVQKIIIIIIRSSQVSLYINQTEKVKMTEKTLLTSDKKINELTFKEYLHITLNGKETKRVKKKIRSNRNYRKWTKIEKRLRQVKRNLDDVSS